MWLPPETDAADAILESGQRALETAMAAALEQGFSEDQAVADVARHHLDAYAKFVYGLQPAPHHIEWCDRIEALVEDRPLWLDGTTKSRKRKLLLTAPPGHAKSTYVSLVLPPWYVGRHPDQHVLFYTSIGPNAANFDGAVAATLEANPRHQLTFPDDAARPNKERGWSGDGRFLRGIPIYDKDPTYRAVGWSQSILGGRADGFVLDDVLTQEQSCSETEQKGAKARYEGTVDTRLVPNGWALGIMTRWHELDLPSYLSKLPDWEHVNYPALVGGDTVHPLYAWNDPTPGPDGKPAFGALWAERGFTAAVLLMKRLANPDLFEAYWQGDPTSLGGSIFKSKHFSPLPEGFAERKNGRPSLLDRLVKVQMWDLNYSEKESADFTVGLTLGIDFLTNKLYVLRVFRSHMDDTQHDLELAREILLARPSLVGIWKGAYEKAPAVGQLVQRLQKLLAGRVATTIIGLDENKDKVMRARLPASYGAAGNLHVNKDARWYPEFVSECLGFPNKAHDDQVDALSGAAQLALEYGVYAQMPQTSLYALDGSPPASSRPSSLLAA